MDRTILKKRTENTIESYSFEIMTISGCTCRSCRCKNGNASSDAYGGIEYSSGSPK